MDFGLIIGFILLFILSFSIGMYIGKETKETTESENKIRKPKVSIPLPKTAEVDNLDFFTRDLDFPNSKK